MELERQACERARRSRDPRFDGRFFIGVTTTGVYCRPVCSAPAPKEANVRYFPTAAAAAAAGFRPCLRCRPECSPGTPAWLGTSTTVSRALRLIGEGALDSAGVEELAAQLGVGPRHLSRLFLRHLGANPVEVAQTRRLHFAKRLIDETRLPLAEVALAAGFGSIRRFNATFQTVYGRTPTVLRQAARRPSASMEQSGKQSGEPNSSGEYCFRLPFRPPLDWEALLAFLEARAIPAVECVQAGCYRRTIALDGRSGEMEARLSGRGSAIELRIRFPEPRGLLAIIERARRLFDLAADPAEIAAHLRQDPLLRKCVARRPGLRVPGAWDAFELAVRAIIGQQVSVRAASTIAGRVARAFGESSDAGCGPLTHLFPTPQALARTGQDRKGLDGSGLTNSRAEAIRALARAVCAGDLHFVAASDPAALTARLCRLPGIGEWTAQYVAMRAAGEPDAFPSGDLVLLRAAGLKTAHLLEQRSAAWRPWRAYAAMHLWQGVKDDSNHLLQRNGKSARAAAAGRR